MRTYTCVYCKELKPPRDFHTEHVIPRAFCRGFRQALTLTRRERPAVCNACNQRFGRTLDLALGRDSYEALLRYQHGLKQVADATELGSKRFSVTLPPDSKLGPIHLSPSARGSRPGLVPVPQVRFRRRTGGYICFTESQLAKENPRVDPDLDTSSVSVYWSGSDEDAGERLKNLLSGYGLTFTQWAPSKDLPEPGVHEIDVEIQGVIDTLIARAVAKIAFNYAVYATYDRDPTFTLRAEFEATRNFLLYGTGHWRDFVRFPAKPILAADTARRRHTRGHLVTVLWEKSPGGDVISQVSLFNDLTYAVKLATRMGGVWWDIGLGHHYNPETMSVERLGRTSLTLPPQLVEPW